ncbi:hypothetical protein Kpol_1045p4 [Vanderwaltozyma polyspora DSM 70294]|uniref:Required for respiratory growth protein 7, mitochondrial n=1 Tax=Vanderwaltozyma polyspora (strain ATCC 22028 / DSM 70294 / BCRC 21397 / CBS 2163 / NBRC 10782 / NRRL Y-8283 / UCD 57-17) TaxID=436907 RepID=RRG7_VANPO|nr:uncharacterized protein Kpol_1045p4 [Vanderwaltozyma polyspora DSM 70294]A7TI13.1 RecName: Full=Required for respiratory growth protein 7, mitochondrial [Vanderwaltozyma polyspora DSM 70294]EDO18020.1 hypothetical protein Kpol_1045p4 [Vanderwaltozyma polyspora DSM 70294]
MMMNPRGFGIKRFKRSINNDSLTKFINDNRNIESSTVFQGNLYEYTVMRELESKLNVINMMKIGGSNDGGIDLVGDWPLRTIYEKMNLILKLDGNKIPSISKINGRTIKPIYNSILKGNLDTMDLKILVQCKAFSSSKVSPKELRELVGAYSTHCNRPSDKNKTIVMMCSPNLLTSKGLELINSVKIPLIYLRVSLIKNLNKEYDIENSGKLLNYYENSYTSELLQNLGVKEWLKLGLYNADLNSRNNVK